MAVAIALVLIVVGSILFHLFSPWWWTPIASNWSYIDRTLTLTFWITGIVFSAVVLFVAYCVFRFRHREGARADYEPESRRLESWLAIVTALGVTALLAPGLFVWTRFISVPKDATEVEVVAQQWLWNFRLPGPGGKLGTANAHLVSAANPLGVNPDDPNSKDNVIIQGADLHLPVGKPVKMVLRSVDVIHDFYVPEFRARMDVVPGMVTYFWFVPTHTGSFDILCAKLCGVGHAFMRGVVKVDTEQDYRAWLKQQSTFAQLSAQNSGTPAQQTGQVAAKAD